MVLKIIVLLTVGMVIIALWDNDNKPKPTQ